MLVAVKKVMRVENDDVVSKKKIDKSEELVELLLMFNEMTMMI
jgi:hypothetical protein